MFMHMLWMKSMDRHAGAHTMHACHVHEHEHGGRDQAEHSCNRAVHVRGGRSTVIPSKLAGLADHLPSSVSF